MAQKVTFVDDMDGSEGAETVSFAFKGKAYEIDLSSKNVDKLMKALQPFIDAGRASGGGTRAPRAPGGANTPRTDYASPDHAGTPHRGRITDAEKLTVKENLDRVNENLKAKGLRTIDPSDAEMKAKYDL